MPRWAELLIAGLIGAVVPVAGGTIYISGLLETVVKLEDNIEQTAQGVAIAAVESALRDEEQVVLMREARENAIESARRYVFEEERAIQQQRDSIAAAENLRIVSEELQGVIDQIGELGAIAELRQKLDEALADPSFREEVINRVLPPEAVVAFDRTGCPSGWSSFGPAGGRTIVGAGQHTNVDENGNELPIYQPGAAGGEEYHTLRPEEMPIHTHRVVEMIGDNDIDGVDSVTTRSGEHHNELRDSGPAGRGEAHNNMQPYVALVYCKKV